MQKSKLGFPKDLLTQPPAFDFAFFPGPDLAYMDAVNLTSFLKYYCDISLIRASRARAGNLHSVFCIGRLKNLTQMLRS